jgi:hypothetical protein
MSRTCSVNKIMLDLKTMGFEMDFPAMKLKTAAGEPACRVLCFLADHVRFLHELQPLLREVSSVTCECLICRRYNTKGSRS